LRKGERCAHSVLSDGLPSRVGENLLAALDGIFASLLSSRKLAATLQAVVELIEQGTGSEGRESGVDMRASSEPRFVVASSEVELVVIEATLVERLFRTLWVGYLLAR
jgi:hypothetical protein